MIRLFRNYHPAVLILLILFIGLMKSSSLFQVTDHQMNFEANPFSELVFFLFAKIPVGVGIVTFVISVAILFVQSILINNLVNELRLLPRSSYLPAFAYLMATSVSQQFLVLNPAMLANTFLIWAVSCIFNFYKREKNFGQIFNTGFLLSIAALFYLPYSVFVFFVFCGLVIMRPFNWREWMVGLIGILIPFYLTFSALYVFDISDLWVLKFQNSFELARQFVFKFPLNFLIPALMILCSVIWTAFNLQSSFFKMLVQTRLCYVLLIWFFVIGSLMFVFQVTDIQMSMQWSIIPVAFGLGYFFSEFKKQTWAELFALSLLLTIVFFQFQSFFSL